jgi:uncharacterized protein YggE
MDHFFSKEDALRVGKLVILLFAVLVLYGGMKFINELKSYGSIGVSASQAGTIDVTGEGEAFAIPDIATISFNAEARAKTVAEAQISVNKIIKESMAFLKSTGIAEKDIKTANYSAYPEYTYPCSDRFCPAGSANTPVLNGYLVTQSISVKVRDTEKTSTVIDGLGKVGVTGLNGPNYSVDNPESIKQEARQKAIANAETKAKALAKDLGVRLVRITRYSEDGGGAYPSPMYMKAEAYGSADAGAALPAGENMYSSRITITYEIR